VASARRRAVGMAELAGLLRRTHSPIALLPFASKSSAA
jgi:hypothetical protein